LRDLNDLFLVDKIVSDVSEKDLKGPVSVLKFKVSWVGFPGEETVESWKDVRNLEQLRNFLADHPRRDYRELIKRLPKSNRGDEEAEFVTEINTDELGVKSNKIRKEIKDKIGVPIDNEITRKDTSENVDESEGNLEEKNLEVDTSTKGKRKKRKWNGGLVVRKSGRVTRKSIRLMRGEEEG